MLGVALSGGGDSLALLHLLHDQLGPGRLRAVTVDHGLRDGSAAEALFAAASADSLGIPHATLRWDWDRTGNLMAEARRARMRLIGDWAQGQGIGMVALGHTQDDQAETVLMQLARGAGVDGLSAMAPQRQEGGITWLRPLLPFRREALRDDLRARGVTWIDDPSNDNPRFDRVRFRQALAVLEPLGVGIPELAATAGRMADARDALEDQVARAAAAHAHLHHGDVVIDRAALFRLLPEVRRRLLLQALTWVSRGGYPPRAATLAAAINAAREGRRHTLHGCLLGAVRDHLRISREPRAVAATTCITTAIWDGRWQMLGPHAPGLEVRALGQAGLSALTVAPPQGLPRASLVAQPAIWRDDTLVAAPLAGQPAGWRAELVTAPGPFAASALSH